MKVDKQIRKLHLKTLENGAAKWKPRFPVRKKWEWEKRKDWFKSRIWKTLENRLGECKTPFPRQVFWRERKWQRKTSWKTGRKNLRRKLAPGSALGGSRRGSHTIACPRAKYLRNCSCDWEVDAQGDRGERKREKC